jgi:hypothetical protein
MGYGSDMNLLDFSGNKTEALLGAIFYNLKYYNLCITSYWVSPTYSIGIDCFK